MPSKYDPGGALPLRVPPELRRDLETFAATLPRGLTLPRNAVAVAALRAGLDVLRAEIGADPFAVHRVYAAAVGSGDQLQVALPSAAGAPTARGNGGARAPRTAPEPSRAPERARPRALPPKASAPPSTPRRAPSAAGAPEPPDAPTPDAVRELLATVLDRDRAAPTGAKGWTVKALAADLGCDRKALQSFRADGSGMGRALQLRVWEALRRDPPPKG